MIPRGECSPLSPRVPPAGGRNWPCRPFSPSALGALALIGWYFTLVPLHYTDLWGHLAYGRLIASSGRLPAVEPFMPLARDVRLTDTAWLTQWGGFLVWRTLGETGLQQAHALFVVLCTGLAAATTWKATRSGVWGMTAGVLWLAATWFQSHVIRPQIVGMACFGLLLWFLSPGRRPLRRPGWLIPLFAAWANLHGSFPLGFLLLGCAIGGRLFDCWRRYQHPLAGLQDAGLRRLTTGLVFALAAVLVNPYGYRIYPAVLAISANPNLADLLEWKPLVASSIQGQIFLAGTLAVVLLAAFSRPPTRRASLGELLAFVLLTCGTLSAVRYIVWWGAVTAPLIGQLCARHHAISRRLRSCERSIGRTRAWHRAGIAWAALATLACLNSGPAAFLWSRSAGGRPRHTLSPATPVAITEFLREHPPGGQLFNTYEWGDYLVWAGPPGLPVFTTSHAHLLPPDVWRDYMAVVRRSPGWRGVFERYQVTNVVIDRRYRSGLIAALEADPDWEMQFADELGAVFGRRSAPAQPGASPP